ncbi:MAG TPA: hypothetical protein V6D43_08865 [Candidatus Sericytochromatia bacterium]
MKFLSFNVSGVYVAAQVMALDPCWQKLIIYELLQLYHTHNDFE